MRLKLTVLMNSEAWLQNINKNCIQPVAVNENEDLSEVWLGACVFAYACECVSVWVSMHLEIFCLRIITKKRKKRDVQDSGRWEGGSNG